MSVVLTNNKFADVSTSCLTCLDWRYGLKVRFGVKCVSFIMRDVGFPCPCFLHSCGWSLKSSALSLRIWAEYWVSVWRGRETICESEHECMCVREGDNWDNRGSVFAYFTCTTFIKKVFFFFVDPVLWSPCLFVYVIKAHINAFPHCVA